MSYTVNISPAFEPTWIINGFNLLIYVDFLLSFFWINPKQIHFLDQTNKCHINTIGIPSQTQASNTAASHLLPHSNAGLVFLFIANKNTERIVFCALLQ